MPDFANVTPDPGTYTARVPHGSRHEYHTARVQYHTARVSHGTSSVRCSRTRALASARARPHGQLQGTTREYSSTRYHCRRAPGYSPMSTNLSARRATTTADCGCELEQRADSHVLLSGGSRSMIASASMTSPRLPSNRQPAISSSSSRHASWASSSRP